MLLLTLFIPQVFLFSIRTTTFCLKVATIHGKLQKNNLATYHPTMLQLYVCTDNVHFHNVILLQGRMALADCKE